MKDRVSITMLQGGIADVRMIRTDKMNALDPAMFAGIGEAIRTLKATAGLRCVILSGEGRAFCAGLDMASMAGGGSGNNGLDRKDSEANPSQFVAWGWRRLEVPVIAAAHGVAFGGGFQILSGADIRIARPDLRCAIMEMKWGLVPDMAGFPLWRTMVRDDLLRELTYTNREFSGTEAHAMGFVTHLSDDPYAHALELAKVIAAKNPHAMRGAKRLCNAMGDLTDAELLVLETDEQLKVIRKPNQVEAVMAAMEKREAVFADVDFSGRKRMGEYEIWGPNDDAVQVKLDSRSGQLPKKNDFLEIEGKKRQVKEIQKTHRPDKTIDVRVKVSQYIDDDIPLTMIVG